MGTIESIIERLEATGCPVTADAFRAQERPAPPYITVQHTGARNMYADGEVYWSADLFDVDLYLSMRDRALEARVLAALDGLAFTWTAEYINAQSCHHIKINLEV